MQNRAMREYAARRGWIVAMQVREVGSGVAKRQAREKLLEAARRREIDVVLVWRLDRWGRSVTDLLTTLQELEHLGVGFVSLTEALDLTTSTGRAMAGLLSVFSEFEREILRERTRAGLAHARQHGKVLGRPMTAGLHAADIRKLHLAGRQQVRDRPPVTNRPYFGPANPGGKVMSRRKRDPAREDRIHNEAIVDAGPDEQALSWYYYLENKIRFPFQAKCLSAKVVSPLKKDQTVRAIRMAPDDLCAHDMLVLVRWQDRKMAVPLSQLTAVDPDESTAEAIGDWHYWVAQGYCL